MAAPSAGHADAAVSHAAMKHAPKRARTPRAPLPILHTALSALLSAAAVWLLIALPTSRPADVPDAHQVRTQSAAPHS